MIGRMRAFAWTALLLGCGGAAHSSPGPTPLAPAARAAAPSAAAILPEAGSPISFERIARFPEPGWQVPRQIRIRPDGASATFLQSESGSDEMSLFQMDLATGVASVLLRAQDLDAAPASTSLAEELRNERQRKRIKGITDYHWADAAPVLLVPASAGTFVREASGTLRQVAKAGAIDPKLSPDGKRVALARDAEIEVVEVESGKVTPLTKSAPKGVTRGQSDFNAQEELDEPSGLFWAPDSRTLAYVEVDESKVQEVPVLGHRGGAPQLMMQKYPEAGRENPRVKVFVADTARRRSEPVPLPDGVASDAYLGRFRFTQDSKRLLFLALDRPQRRLSLIVSELGAKPSSKVLYSEQVSRGWVGFSDLVVSGSEAFVTRDTDGHRHLFAVSLAGGEPRRLTHGAWDVLAILGKDEAGGRVFVSTTELDPIGATPFSVSIKDGARTALSSFRGTHQTSFGIGGAFATVMSSRTTPPRAEIHARGRVWPIATVADPDISALGLRSPEPLKLEVNGVTLHGALLAPRELDPAKRYPLLLMVYGGPGVQTVQDRWAPRLFWQHMADRGFFVMQIDNRGTAHRGSTFESPISGRLGEIELSDQLAALDQVLAQRPIDPSRVAIYGHSYGGFMAAYAMLKAPKRFRAGIAASPVTDWRLYDTGYTERYMGLPKENAAGYDASTLAPLAKHLEGRLLLVHALMDENVHFQNSADLIDAFIREKKDFRMFIFPGERHGYRSPEARSYVAQLTSRFLVESLAPSPVPLDLPRDPG